MPPASRMWRSVIGAVLAIPLTVSSTRRTATPGSIACRTRASSTTSAKAHVWRPLGRGNLVLGEDRAHAGPQLVRLAQGRDERAMRLRHAQRHEPPRDRCRPVAADGGHEQPHRLVERREVLRRVALGERTAADDPEHARGGSAPVRRVRDEDRVDPVGQDGGARSERVVLEVEIARGGDAGLATGRRGGAQQVLDADPPLGVVHLRLVHGAQGVGRLAHSVGIVGRLLR